MSLLMRSATAAALLGLLGLAQAEDKEIYVPGTGISYSVTHEKQDGMTQNTSTVYIDEVNDTTNKTYAAFQCNKGAPYFYLRSKNPLVTPQMLKTGQLPTLWYQVDGGARHSLNTQSWGDGEDFDPNYLLLEDSDDAPMLRLFRGAKSRMTLRVQRAGYADLVYTFDTRGIDAGLRAVSSCK